MFDSDQRLGFLHTFLNKTVAAELPLEKRTLDVSYSLVKTADPSVHEWWLGTEMVPNKGEPIDEEKD